MENRNQIEKIQSRMVELSADTMKYYGLSATIGRVLGIAHIEKKPMTLDELAEKAGMSKTRMSQVVRDMQDLNIAEKIFQKGTRKDLIDTEQDPYQTFISLFTSNWRKAVMKNRKIEHKILGDLQILLEDDTVDEDTRHTINEMIEDTKDSLAFYDWLNRFVDFVEGYDILEYVPKKKK